MPVLGSRPLEGSRLAGEREEPPLVRRKSALLMAIGLVGGALLRSCASADWPCPTMLGVTRFFLEEISRQWMRFVGWGNDGKS